MIDRLSKRDEEGVVDAIAESIKLANDGMEPSEAIAKSASARGYNRNFATRMVEAFNVSKSMKHHKESEGEKRADTFSLADAKRVHAIMFPEKVDTPAEKSASVWMPVECGIVEDKYYFLDRAPTAEKHAEVNTWKEQDPNSLMTRAYGEVEHKKLALQQATNEARDLRELALKELIKLSDYYRSIEPREPFDNLESAALQSYGEQIRPAMDLVYMTSKAASFGHVRASGPSKAVPKLSIDPYKLLSSAMGCQQQYLAKQAALQAQRAEVAKFVERVDLAGRLMAKGGQVRPLLSGMLANKALSKQLGGGDSLYDALLTATESLEDPSLEAERKSIRAKMLLKELMESDEVLSQQSPEDVVNAFNEIASLAPRAAESPMTMRALLRKRIEQGSVDPMDITNIANLENTMRESEQPTPLMREAYKGIGAGELPKASKSPGV